MSFGLGLMATTRDIRTCWFHFFFFCISCPHLHYDGNAGLLALHFFSFSPITLGRGFVPKRYCGETVTCTGRGVIRNEMEVVLVSFCVH